jgi:hypothetical protein
MKNDTARLKRIGQLMELQRGLLDQVDALREEIATLAGGGHGIGERLAALEAHFDQLWGVRYAKGEPGKYVWKRDKERPHLKALLRQLGDAEVRQRMIRFMESNEEFYERGGPRSFGLFVAVINQLAAPSTATAADDADAVADTRRLLESLHRE